MQHFFELFLPAFSLSSVPSAQATFLRPRDLSTSRTRGSGSRDSVTVIVVVVVEGALIVPRSSFLAHHIPLLPSALFSPLFSRGKKFAFFSKHNLAEGRPLADLFCSGLSLRRFSFSPKEREKRGEMAARRLAKELKDFKGKGGIVFSLATCLFLSTFPPLSCRARCVWGFFLFR